MIDDINPRLWRWAEWVLRHEGGALGYPSECSYTRLQGQSDGGYVPNVDSEAWQTEQAIILLRQSNIELHKVIIVKYCGIRSDGQMFRACQCSERTFYRRLDDARTELKKIIDRFGSDTV